MTRLWHGFRDGVLLREASTRSSGLLRIALALLCWSTFAHDVLPWRSFAPERLVLTASFFASTTLMLVGLSTRLSTLWAAGTLLAMVFGYERWHEVELWRHHHTTVLALAVALSTLTPGGSSYSVDRYLAVRRAVRAGVEVPPERGPVWGLTLVALHCSIVYLFGAIDKTHWGFLDGTRLETILMSVHFGSDYPDLPGFGLACTAAAWATVGLEYLLVFGLFVRSWQRVLVPLGLAMHAAFYLILPVDTFSVTMMAIYLAYLDPDAVHRFLDLLQQPRAADGRSAPAPEPAADDDGGAAA